MTTTTATNDTPVIDEERVGAFIGRLFDSCVATGELVTLDLGQRLVRPGVVAHMCGTSSGIG